MQIIIWWWNDDDDDEMIVEKYDNMMYRPTPTKQQATTEHNKLYGPD